MEEIKTEIKKNKIKLGILGCFYNCHENIDKKLNPWFNRPESKTDFVFSFVSSPFKEYIKLGIKQDNTETEKALKFLKDNGLIQYLEISDKPLIEAEVRNLALKHILDEKCDYVCLLDGDEFYSEKDVHNILFTLNDPDNQFYAWMEINFKNFVFDTHQWIDSFSPPRIFKVNINNSLKLDCFIGDNDISYTTLEGGYIDYRQLPYKCISKDLINPKHYSWLSNETSKNKIKYQRARWGENGCSYAWDEINDKLIFNTEYFKDKPYPVVNKD